jgi:hypothetical protein
LNANASGQFLFGWNPNPGTAFLRRLQRQFQLPRLQPVYQSVRAGIRAQQPHVLHPRFIPFQEKFLAKISAERKTNYKRCTLHSKLFLTKKILKNSLKCRVYSL